MRNLSFDAACLCLALFLGSGLITPLLAQAQPDANGWPAKAFRELSEKYLAEQPPAALDAEERQVWIGRLFREIGARLAQPETVAAAPSPADVALISYLYAQAAPPGGEDAQAAGPQDQAPADPADPGADPDQAAPDPAQPRRNGFADINKGDEGFAQGVERLAELPISERLVMTGDVTGGLQAAVVGANPDLTSAFGRARMNFVLQALPESPGGNFSDGYFFVQMRTAGGPDDVGAIGGPASFTPLNDVAADRSRFNEGTSRGNIYLSKAFYEQSLRLEEGELRGRAGIINLTDFFDTNVFANNEARQFLNGAFVNGAAFKTGISAPGIMTEYERDPWIFRPLWLEKIRLRAGYALSQTERAFTSPLWAGELELETTLDGKPGHWRIGGTVGNVADAGRVSSFHINVDQWLTRDIGVFGRFGRNTAGAGALRFGPVRWSYSGGFQRRFVDQRDRVSAFAVAFSHAFPTEGSGDLISEKIFETYYRWQITRNAALSPDFQLVIGSGGARSQGVHTVYGVRLFFAY